MNYKTWSKEEEKRFDDWLNDNFLRLRHMNVDEAHEAYKEALKEHDERLLEMIRVEIGKLEYCSKCCSPKGYCLEWGMFPSAIDTKDLLTLLTTEEHE